MLRSLIALILAASLSLGGLPIPRAIFQAKAQDEKAQGHALPDRLQARDFRAQCRCETPGMKRHKENFRIWRGLRNGVPVRTRGSRVCGEKYNSVWGAGCAGARYEDNSKNRNAPGSRLVLKAQNDTLCASMRCTGQRRRRRARALCGRYKALQTIQRDYPTRRCASRCSKRWRRRRSCSVAQDAIDALNAILHIIEAGAAARAGRAYQAAHQLARAQKTIKPSSTNRAADEPSPRLRAVASDARSREEYLSRRGNAGAARSGFLRRAQMEGSARGI